MTMLPDDAMTKTAPVQRFEVFTGAGQRRKWSAQAKARMIAESYSGAETVCEVARRYGLAPTQLFTWRRQAKRSEPSFVPVVIEPQPAPVPAAPALRKSGPLAAVGGIELEIDGAVMRISPCADIETVTAVIRALKASR